PAEHAPAAAVRDPAELLDVHMDQLARDLLLVADRFRLADGQPGGLVNVVQQRHPVPLEDPPDRGARDAKVVADPVRPPPPGEPCQKFQVLGAYISLPAVCCPTSVFATTH